MRWERNRPLLNETDEENRRCSKIGAVGGLDLVGGPKPNYF